MQFLRDMNKSFLWLTWVKHRPRKHSSGSSHERLRLSHLRQCLCWSNSRVGEIKHTKRHSGGEDKKNDQSQESKGCKTNRVNSASSSTHNCICDFCGVKAHIARNCFLYSELDKTKIPEQAKESIKALSSKKEGRQKKQAAKYTSVDTPQKQPSNLKIILLVWIVVLPSAMEPLSGNLQARF